VPETTGERLIDMKVTNSELAKALRLISYVPSDTGFASSEHALLQISADQMLICSSGRAVAWGAVPITEGAAQEFCIGRRHLTALLEAAENSGAEDSTWTFKGDQVTVQIGKQRLRLTTVKDVVGFPEREKPTGTRFSVEPAAMRDMSMLAKFTSASVEETDAVVVNGAVGAATDRILMAAVKWNEPASKKSAILPSLLMKAADKEGEGKLVLGKTGMYLTLGDNYVFCPAKMDYPLAALKGVLSTIGDTKTVAKTKTTDLLKGVQALSPFAFDAPEYVAEVALNKTSIELKLPLQSGEAKTQLAGKSKQALTGRWALTGLQHWLDRVSSVSADADVEIKLGDKQWCFRTPTEEAEYLLVMVRL